MRRVSPRGFRLLSTLTLALIALAVALPWRNAQATPSGDARRALNTVLPELNLAGVTLADALEFARDVSSANIHVNWPALEAAGVSKDTPVNVRVRNVSLRKVLNLVLSESGSGVPLTFYIDDGVIEVTTRELADRVLITKVYPIDDLILEVPDFVGPEMNLEMGNGQGGGQGGPFQGGGQGNNGDDKGTSRVERAEALIDLITEVIQPDIWQKNGGTAAIRFFNGSLIVTAPRSVHEALGGPTD